MTSETIAIILARAGSKGIKNKNIKRLNGKPLIAWSIKTCLQSKYIKKIVVSTDSKKYAKIEKKYGAHEVIMRPKNISKNSSVCIDAIIHTIKNLKYKNFDFVAHIRPTTPERNVKDIDNAIKAFKNSNFSSLRTVHEMSESAYKSSLELFSKKQLKPMKNTHFTMDDLNKPRQYFKKTFTPNGVVDIYRKKFILKNKKLFGNRVMAFKTKFTHEIDTIEQFRYIEYRLKKN